MKHVILIHGTWGKGARLAAARGEFERRGFTVHTPTLRYHDLPLAEGAPLIAPLSLRDYTDDLVELARSLDSPPLLLGSSLGGLLAQLVAARVPNYGVVAACPAPARGIFARYPSMIRLLAHHYLQFRPWTKPLYPTWRIWRKGVANTQPEQVARSVYAELVCESGRAYCEIAFSRFDRYESSRVDYSAVATPVLVFGASEDKIVNWRIGRDTARRFKNSEFVKIMRSDHLVMYGEVLSETMSHIDRWMASHDIRSFQPVKESDLGTGPDGAR